MRPLGFISAVVVASFICASNSFGQGSKSHTPEYGIAFAGFGPLNSDIFIADADGKNAHPLSPHPALDINASFSPDGRSIIFTSMRDGTGDIYRVNIDGSGLRRLTRDPAFDDQGALSPDGRFLAFTSSRSGQADIWILDLKTGALRNLTNHPGGDFRAAWSPDGQWIAFSSDRMSRHPRSKAQFFTLQSTEVFIVHPDGSGLRQITHDDAFTGSPSWSADGKSLFCHQASIDELDNIVSARRLRGTTQIMRIDMATGGQTVLTGGKGEKWSPQQLADGRIGYVSGGPEGGVEFAGGAPGARGEIRNPRWSPDGRHMAFQRDVDTNWPPFKPWPSRDPMIRLVRMGVFPSWSEPLVIENDQTAGVLHNSILALKPDGTGQKVLFTDADRTALAPVLSRQGDRIAFGLGGFFQMVKGKSVADIAVINTDGTGLRLLTDGSGNAGFPNWSPDGKLIVYRRSTETGSSLFILDIATRASHLLTSGRHENFPTWSPKGDRIAFTSDRTGDYEIYTIRPDGTGLTQLTHSPGNEGHNSWSPDGEWIAFTSAHEGYKDEALLHPHNPQSYGDIYIMRADGSDMRMLTDDPYEEGTPSWFAVAPAR
ncbi:MAG: hypothetical protein P4L72_09500 [Parvibaculum sp.]|uniref:hypothetical protein n=1 Tax=Parvibaculum sp. TaxID=2024848 RepID=UPI00284DFB87|nr:hypothetical protein [Parvibaculum sp.]MDR3499448.1 hypothetical protein [Parvibaculum sp.]